MHAATSTNYDTKQVDTRHLRHFQNQSARLYSVCDCVLVAELLYAVQWCKEMEFSPAVVADYHNLLADWELPTALLPQVTTKELLETLYTRY